MCLFDASISSVVSAEWKNPKNSAVWASCSPRSHRCAMSISADWTGRETAWRPRCVCSQSSITTSQQERRAGGATLHLQLWSTQTKQPLPSLNSDLSKTSDVMRKKTHRVHLLLTSSCSEVTPVGQFIWSESVNELQLTSNFPLVWFGFTQAKFQVKKKMHRQKSRGSCQSVHWSEIMSLKSPLLHRCSSQHMFVCVMANCCLLTKSSWAHNAQHSWLQELV